MAWNARCPVMQTATAAERGWRLQRLYTKEACGPPSFCAGCRSAGCRSDAVNRSARGVGNHMDAPRSVRTNRLVTLQGQVRAWRCAAGLLPQRTRTKPPRHVALVAWSLIAAACRGGLSSSAIAAPRTLASEPYAASTRPGLHRVDGRQGAAIEGALAQADAATDGAKQELMMCRPRTDRARGTGERCGEQRKMGNPETAIAQVSPTGPSPALRSRTRALLAGGFLHLVCAGFTDSA